jgi:hypothetical protein
MYSGAVTYLPDEVFFLSRPKYLPFDIDIIGDGHRPQSNEQFLMKSTNPIPINALYRTIDRLFAWLKASDLENLKPITVH